MAQGSIEVEQQASKILGKEAKIPSVNKYVEKPSSTRGDAGTAFTKAVNDADSALSEYQNSCSALANAIERYINLIEKDDLGLDLKNKEELKKIVQARKILTTFYADAKKRIEDDVKSLDALDKKLAEFAKFKPALFW